MNYLIAPFFPKHCCKLLFFKIIATAHSLPATVCDCGRHPECIAPVSSYFSLLVDVL